MNPMSWSAIGPAVFSLVGVTLGTTGSILGQYLATRTTKEQARAGRYTALRWERKDAIREFLEIVQQVEHLAERRYQQGHREEGADVLTHRMWYMQKNIDLVGTPQLRQATLDYAWRLHEAVYKELPEGMNVWDFMSDCRDPFMEAARTELDIPDLEQHSTKEPKHG